MIKLIDLIKENMKVTPAQVKKLNKRLIDKGYEGFEFQIIGNGQLKIYYTDWRKNPTENDEYIYGLLQSFIHTSKTFDDLYYSIL